MWVQSHLHLGAASNVGVGPIARELHVICRDGKVSSEKELSSYSEELFSIQVPRSLYVKFLPKGTKGTKMRTFSPTLVI